MTVHLQDPPVGGLLRHIEIRGFRSARHAEFSPRHLCALVGEARSGKSTILSAIRAVLDPASAPLSQTDLTFGETRISIQARLASGAALSVEWPPNVGMGDGESPSVLFLPSAERAGTVVATTGNETTKTGAVELFRDVLGERSDDTSTGPALGLVEAVERCCDTQATGLILLVEEPELFLRPQTQRYLYRLLRRLSIIGNQVIYSTHSSAFLNVARLDELGFVTLIPDHGTHVLHPEPVPAQDEFRVLSEFDAERSELFLAQSVILVEGSTEKLTFPHVFRAMGHDADRLGITIVECGGKPNIPLFARICKSVGVPFIAVHDRDAPPGSQPIASERLLNQLIAEIAGKDRTIVLEPDFEAAAGIRGHSHKPERAWRRFTSLTLDAIPPELKRTAELAIALARGHGI